MNLSYCSFDHEVTKYLDLDCERDGLTLHIELTSELDTDYIDEEELERYADVEQQERVVLHFAGVWSVGFFLSGLVFSAHRNGFQGYAEGRALSLADALRQVADVLGSLAGARRREDVDWLREEDCAARIDELLAWFPESTMG